MTPTQFKFLISFFFIVIQGDVIFVESRCTGYSSPITSTATSGEIQSPRYPNSYRDNENCRWSLNFPFDHKHYIVLFNVDDVQISYKKFGNNGKKCTGHLSFFGVETDCQTETPFCKVYYVTSECEKVVNKFYSSCQIYKKSNLIPTEVQFKSDSYYYDRTPQRGFELRYEFINCFTALKTTTTTTTTTTTATTTTTPSTTPEVTTPLLTTPEVTTSALATTPEMTTTEALTTTAIASTTEKMTTQSTTTPGMTSSEPTTPSTQKIVTTATSDQSDTIGFRRLVMVIGPTPSITSSTTSERGVNSTSSLANQGCGENSGCIQKLSGCTVSILWIIGPIAGGVIVIIVVLFILISRWRRKKRSEDITYLMGMENPNFNDLRKKNGEVTVPKSA